MGNKFCYPRHIRGSIYIRDKVAKRVEIARRKSDGTLWYPSYDLDDPTFVGYYFRHMHRVDGGYYIHWRHIWRFTDESLFDMVKAGT